jgi:Protein of unknown function (DUF3455)
MQRPNAVAGTSSLLIAAARACKRPSARRSDSLFVSVVAAATLVLCAAPARAQVPAAIAAPDMAPVVTLHAAGAQIYECKAGDDGKLAWTFREPIAALFLDGRTVGRHFAGPVWEHSDGSSIVAKALASAPGAAADDIAWLKLEVSAHRGTAPGVLSGIDVVQRINTHGGVLHGPCDKAGDLRAAPYAADYVFLHKGG